MNLKEEIKKSVYLNSRNIPNII